MKACVKVKNSRRKSATTVVKLIIKISTLTTSSCLQINNVIKFSKLKFSKYVVRVRIGFHCAVLGLGVEIPIANLKIKCAKTC